MLLFLFLVPLWLFFADFLLLSVLDSLVLLAFLFLDYLVLLFFLFVHLSLPAGIQYINCWISFNPFQAIHLTYSNFAAVSTIIRWVIVFFSFVPSLENYPRFFFEERNFIFFYDLLEEISCILTKFDFYWYTVTALLLKSIEVNILSKRTMENFLFWKY